jgi:hypothetical protein
MVGLIRVQKELPTSRFLHETPPGKCESGISSTGDQSYSFCKRLDGVGEEKYWAKPQRNAGFSSLKRATAKLASRKVEADLAKPQLTLQRQNPRKSSTNTQKV